MFRLTRRYRFSAAHRLASPYLDERSNAEIYGKCNNPAGHGHNYYVEISVAGPLHERTAQVVDRARLDHLVETCVLSGLRHADLNRAAPELENLPPTTENLAGLIARRLLAAWPEFFPREQPRLDRVLVRETRRNSVELIISDEQI